MWRSACEAVNLARDHHARGSGHTYSAILLRTAVSCSCFSLYLTLSQKPTALLIVANMSLPQATIPNLMLKEGTDRSIIKPVELVTSWLSDFEDAIEAGDSAAVDKLFLEDSWWRDVLALSWKFRALHTEQIGDAIKEAQKAKLANLKAASKGVLIPQVEEMGPFTLVTSAFTFETRFGSGKGYLRLGNSGPNIWKAWTIMTNLQEIRGHEELHKKSIGPNWTSPQDDAAYSEISKKEPRVVIIGGGHSGLAIAARLKQLGVPALTVDKNAR